MISFRDKVRDPYGTICFVYLKYGDNSNIRWPPFTVICSVHFIHDLFIISDFSFPYFVPLSTLKSVHCTFDFVHSFTWRTCEPLILQGLTLLSVMFPGLHIGFEPYNLLVTSPVTPTSSDSLLFLHRDYSTVRFCRRGRRTRVPGTWKKTGTPVVTNRDWRICRQRM